MLLRLPTSINCNAILYGLPKVLLNRVQLDQNRAAHIVTFTQQHEYITPSLTDLHLFVTRGTFFIVYWQMGLQLGDLYVGGGGLKAVVYGNLFQTFRHWGMHKEEKKKQEKTLHFLLLYFSPSECLEQFIISYIAVLSYLEQ